MEIAVNGVKENFDNESLSVTDLLKIKNVDMPDMVSVELNEEILDRENYEVTFLKAGDQIEFLYFMGGGNSI